MGRSALSTRRRGAAVAFVTVSLALAGSTLPAVPAAAATVQPPWSSPVSLYDYKSEVQDVVIAKSGTAVAVWTQYTTGVLYWATRPANSEKWTTARILASETVGKARLAALPDGSVAAVWTTTAHIASATLGAGRSAWSQPTVIASDQSTNFDSPDLAVGPGGTIAAVWSQRVWRTGRSEAYAATMSGEGSWSIPAQVSNAATYAGVSGYGTVGHPQVAYDGQGGLVVSYWMSVSSQYYRVMTNTRPFGASTWPTPQEITAASVAPELASAPDGSVHLVWQDANGTFQIVRRADAASAWSRPQTAATAVGKPTEVPQPLVGPDGDVTLVWTDKATGAGAVRATTFDSAGGTWSAPRTLSSGDAQYTSDAVISPDGSVHVLWPELDADQQHESVWESTLAGGTWTSARRVGGGRSVHVEIAADAVGSATAVWGPSSTISPDTEVMASTMAWPTLQVTDSAVPAKVFLNGTTSSSAAWKPSWTTNSPVASWTLTLKDTAGRTVRTLTGDPGSATTIAPVWNGRTSTGAIAENGRLTWTLKAVQYGSGTASTLQTGTVAVAGGRPAIRDFGGGADIFSDGFGDLLQLDTSGRLQWLLGTGHGDLTGGEIGGGWSTSIKAVPFGDLNGDRCNDFLVRVGDALRAYRPGCGNAPSAAGTPYKTVSSTGWKQYDVLTCPGDVTKDGRPDLIARNSPTGAVYLYKGTSSGTLSARVKLYANWKTYKKVVGAGDLNGDGIGDLVAQDTSNNLYRYYGKGNGTFAGRVKIAGNWGGSYNVAVGVGDITGDGRNDLIARDTTGNLYRQSGDGRGSYGTRVRIGSGFSRAKELF
ncbi:FG-GAP-like repeat-containing protein [Streptomyces sp. NRRL S-1022]|uniref:FG-GAP-like repeat-containing protein n=1 Tax=Streptomyces sp. NRRL S-1022 TaxID=1463880 RepID=UPI000AC15244|nr:FG-GAP-like repeat-containing protein [Streptomyces sp. NRRL S-1022]